MPITVTAVQQIDLLEEVFQGLGATVSDSAIQAEILTEADLRGLPSHGIQRLPVLVARSKAGLLRVDARPTITRTADAVISIDGNDGLGPPIVEQAMAEAHTLVRERGIVAIAIRRTSHLGMLGYYSQRRAREGLVCIGFTTSEALVHPYGGAEPLLGTNPISVGFPALPRPFVFDMATSAIPFGKIISSMHRGEALEEGSAIDAEGRPTTDPRAALTGSLAPVAGPKGSGLGVAIALLAGLLPNADVGRAVKGTIDVESPCNKGDLFILMDPMVFPGGPWLVERASDYLREIRLSKPQSGFDQVLVAGDRGFELREQRLRDGIPHPEEVWRAIEQIRDDVRR